MYCRNCGKEIKDDASFCPYCGKPIVTEQYTGGAKAEETVSAKSEQQYFNSEENTYTLTIVRTKQWFAVNPAVKVTIDGERKFDLENDSTICIPVTPGEHVVVFTCGPRKRIIKPNVHGNVALCMHWNRVTGSIDVD